ncbi:MAG TPA: esterase [Mycobacterium sp.]|jgi:hypothetical protein|nr:esterase [Mycobacterium sp.]
MRILRVAAILVAGVLACSTGISTAAGQSACADLGGAVGPDGICTVHAANPTYTLNFSFPNDYPDQAALTGYLTQARDGFINVADNPDAYNLPYELDAKGAGYSSGSPTGGTQSVVFTMWQNVGGAHPQTYYQSFNWDVDKRAPIKFDTLFKPGTKPLDLIYPAVEQDLQKQQGVIDGIPPSVGLDPSKYQNFALTDDAVLFFFSQGELFAEAAGPVQASVPRSTLAPLLA